MTDVTRPPTVLELFGARVRLTPDATAAWDPHRRVTYGELNDQANRLTRRLAHLGVGRESLVAVMTDPSIDMLVASLGVVKTGGAYVPLDPTWTAPMLAAALRDCKARVLVTSRGAGALRGFVEDAVALHDDRAARRVMSAASGATVTEPARLFSVVYTSGTTARPKGVLIPESAVLNRLSWMWSAHPYTASDVSLLYRSHGAIGFMWDCFGPLLQGVPILIAPPAGVRDPRDLVAACVARGVSHVSASAGRWEAIVEYVDQHAIDWPTLRLARCSGEALPARLVARWRRVFPHVALLNIYGATECSSTAAYDTSAYSGSDRVPVGTAVPNVSIHMVDEALHPAPPGTIGEVCVGGACVARGYLDNPALTAARFVPDPFCGHPGGRMFRTGDLGVYTPDVGLAIVGRRDRQVKIRGFRVELEEVEAALRECAGVRAAAVVAEERRPGDVRLVAYVVPDRREWSPIQLRSLMAQQLPDHMVPADFIELREMPLTATGKIARALLPTSARRRDRPSHAEPMTPTEAAVAEIWRTVFEVDSLRIDDDFFDLGGDSLRGLQVLTRVYASLGVEIPLGVLLDQPTIRTLAAAIDSARDSGASSLVELANETRADVRRIVIALAPAARELSDGESFFETAAVDSVTFLSILREIEQRYALSLSSGDVLMADLSSIRRIATYVAGRRSASLDQGQRG